MPRPRYPTDLTSAQWEHLRPLLPPPAKVGRRRRTDLREVVNGVLYRIRTGCQWRALPHDLPPWGTVAYYFYRWSNDGTWKRIHDALRRTVRKKAGRAELPTAAIIDSQSVKTAEKGGPEATTAGRGSRAASATSSSM